jgi:hypothetical protein
MRTKRKSTVAVVICAAIALCMMPSTANAQLQLTPAGIADGFTLSTFVSGYTPADYGPLAQ